MGIVVAQNGVNYPVKNIPLSVNGVNVNAKSAWAGVGGVNQRVFSGAVPYKSQVINYQTNYVRGKMYTTGGVGTQFMGIYATGEMTTSQRTDAGHEIWEVPVGAIFSCKITAVINSDTGSSVPCFFINCGDNGSAGRPQYNAHSDVRYYHWLNSSCEDICSFTVNPPNRHPTAVTSFLSFYICFTTRYQKSDAAVLIIDMTLNGRPIEFIN